jgi:hypothetical protein
LRETGVQRRLLYQALDFIDWKFLSLNFQLTGEAEGWRAWQRKVKRIFSSGRHRSAKQTKTNDSIPPSSLSVAQPATKR